MKMNICHPVRTYCPVSWGHEPLGLFLGRRLSIAGWPGLSRCQIFIPSLVSISTMYSFTTEWTGAKSLKKALKFPSEILSRNKIFLLAIVDALPTELHETISNSISISRYWSWNRYSYFFELLVFEEIILFYTKFFYNNILFSCFNIYFNNFINISSRFTNKIIKCNYRPLYKITNIQCSNTVSYKYKNFKLQ